MKIGFIGCGNMASAMIGGIIKNQVVAPADILASAKTEVSREKKKEELGIAMTADNREVAAFAEVLILAVKPFYYEDVIKEITSIVDGPISGEVKATTVDAEGMIAEGREIAAIHPNMVVKIPMTVEGLKACKVLTAEGIKTNVTLIFTANQALLAARAGATYVSPFLGRLDDISTRGVDLIREIAEIFDVAGLDTQIIAASVRNPIHVTDCALAGADIATVPYAVIEQMTKHPLTDAGIKKFQDDYKAVFGE